MGAASSEPCILWLWRHGKASHSSFFLPVAVGRLWTLIGRGGAYPSCRPREGGGHVGLAAGDRPHSPCVGLPRPWSLAGRPAVIYLTEPRQSSKRFRNAYHLSMARASQSFPMGKVRFASGRSLEVLRMWLLAKRSPGPLAGQTTSALQCVPRSPRK